MVGPRNSGRRVVKMTVGIAALTLVVLSGCSSEHPRVRLA